MLWGCFQFWSLWSGLYQNIFPTDNNDESWTIVGTTCLKTLESAPKWIDNGRERERLFPINAPTGDWILSLKDRYCIRWDVHFYGFPYGTPHYGLAGTEAEGHSHIGWEFRVFRVKLNTGQKKWPNLMNREKKINWKKLIIVSVSCKTTSCGLSDV